RPYYHIFPSLDRHYRPIRARTMGMGHIGCFYHDSGFCDGIFQRKHVDRTVLPAQGKYGEGKPMAKSHHPLRKAVNPRSAWILSPAFGPYGIAEIAHAIREVL